MAGKNTAVFGIYPTRSSAENAVDALKAANFRNTDISVLLPEGAGTKDFAHEKNTKAPEGATTGAGTGAVLGVRWDGCWELALLRFLAWDRSSRRDQSWQP
jgi:hypothetical protein